MGQSNWIAAFLIIGFIVFITMRGELSKYLNVLGIGNSNAAAANAAGAGAAAAGSLPPLPKL